MTLIWKILWIFGGISFHSPTDNVFILGECIIRTFKFEQKHLVKLRSGVHLKYRIPKEMIVVLLKGWSGGW